MKQSDLRPAREFALRHGVKSMVHGAPGTGKTPIANTAPRPVLLCVEPGMLSMRKSQVPTFCAPTGARIDEFFEWLFGSNERKNFETVCIDSTSGMADVYLREALQGTSKGGNQVHGQAAYGQMLRNTMKHLWPLFFLEQCHTYLICQQGTTETGKLIPGFPGRALEKEVPHLYDEILALGTFMVPGAGMVKAFKTTGQNDVLARDRSGMLNEFEPCDLTALFNKCMS